MKCSIISIGTELNLGLTINTNSIFISKKLAELGIECSYIFTVKDNKNDIIDIFNFALKKTNIIIICGGLGPTDDDLTREAISEAMDLKLYKNDSLDNASLRFIRNKLTPEIKRKLLNQSYIPLGSTPMVPNIGSASGFIIKAINTNKFIFALPGVPREMEDMLECNVLPFIKINLRNENIKIKKSVLLTTDISESEIEQKIKDIYPFAKKINTEIGITAIPGIIKIIILSSAKNDDDNIKKIELIEEKLYSRIGKYIYGKNEDTVAEALKNSVIKKNKNITICAAESLTGGLISSMITDAAGSSNYFKGSIISYTDYSKINILNINQKKLDKFHAVSNIICRDMAVNAQRIFQSDFSIAVSGYAGPDLSENKTGLVYCHIFGPGKIDISYEKNFKGNRLDIKFRTAQFILNKLRQEIDRF